LECDLDIVIDENLEQIGQTAGARLGFWRLLAEVGVGHVGRVNATVNSPAQGVSCLRNAPRLRQVAARSRSPSSRWSSTDFN
jgi:hypothetical protein